MNNKQRIFTVDDLYECCLKNNVVSFSAEDSNKRLIVSANGYFESEEDIVNETEGLLGLKVKIFHTGMNLNKSSISKEVAEKYMGTIKNRPLLAYIHQLPNGDYDFKQHDRKTIINEDGVEEVEYIESPIGHFTNDEPWLEEDSKTKGKYFILGKALVYEEYTKACDILRRKNGSKCSMEIEIENFTFDRKKNILNIESFYIRGVTLLGSKVDALTNKVTEVKAGMDGAEVTLDDFMTVDTFERQCVDKEQKGGKSDMTKFEELLAKYNKTAEEVDIEPEGKTDDELEKEFEDKFKDEIPEDEKDKKSAEEPEEKEDDSEDEDVEPKEEPETEEKSKDEESEDEESKEENPEEEDSEEGAEEDGDEEDPKKESDKFSLSVKKLENGNVQVSYELSHEDIKSKIYAELQKAGHQLDCLDSETCHWMSLVAVYKDHFVFAHNTCLEEELLAQKYMVDENDNLIFVEEPYKVHTEFLTDNEYTALNEMRAQYETVVKELEEYKDKEARKEKEDVLKEDETFSEYLNEAEFEELLSNIDNYSLEEFKDKADSAYGKCVKRMGGVKEKKNENFAIHRKQLFSFENRVTSPYGDLFSNKK